MNNNYTCKIALSITSLLLYSSLMAQYTPAIHTNNKEVQQANKRMDDYLELSKLGYTDRAIFEDLGNANFLVENYETAAFWYEKLKELSTNNRLSPTYAERYQYAHHKLSASSEAQVQYDKDWFVVVKQDYVPNKPTVAEYNRNAKYRNFRELEFVKNADLDGLEDYAQTGASQNTPLVLSKNNKRAIQGVYVPPISLSMDGKTAYFSKPVAVKPLNGIFSKDQTLHKIYRAKKINGQWKHMEELALCPKYYSAVHPTVSEDGKRLFFASDMPGTYGKYDIYVSNIRQDGSIGIAKNLGEKVNTSKNDLYPKIIGGNSLVFASDGHKGKGGLDIFAVQVAQRRVGKSINLGSPINSAKDDFSILMSAEKGMGYVVSNRHEMDGSVEQIAFSYDDLNRNAIDRSKDYYLAEILNNKQRTNYSSTIFEED